MPYHGQFTNLMWFANLSNIVCITKWSKDKLSNQFLSLSCMSNLFMCPTWKLIIDFHLFSVIFSYHNIFAHEYTYTCVCAHLQMTWVPKVGGQWGCIPSSLRFWETSPSKMMHLIFLQIFHKNFKYFSNFQNKVAKVWGETWIWG